MKLSIHQLEKNFPLLPIYFIHGDETLLAQEAQDTLVKKLREQGYQSRQIFFIDTQFDWKVLSEEINNFNLFSEKSIIELRFISGKIGKDGSEILQNILENPNMDKIIMLKSPKLESGVMNSKAYKLIEKLGAVLPIFPIKSEEFPRWLAERCKNAKLTIDSEGLKLLSEYTEGNLLAAQQEIEKLSLIYPDGQLSSDQLKQSISDHARYDIFALVDAWLENKPSRYERILKRLEQEDMEPTLILWALTREYRLLTKIAYSVQRGVPIATACQEQGVWHQRLGLIKKHLMKHSLDYYYRLLQSTAKIDRMIKGLQEGNLWQEFTLLSTDLEYAGS